MLFDAHVHTKYSFDSGMTLRDAMETARRVGLDGFCVTEHVDFDETTQLEGYHPADVSAYFTAYGDARREGKAPFLRLGLEIALKDEESDRKTLEWISGAVPDYLIGSCHNTDAGDPYEDEYYRGRSREEAYGLYLESILLRMQSCDWFHVLGHYDYVAKHAPYMKQAMTYGDGPVLFDEILATLIRRGQGLEINTSPQRNKSKSLWGFDILRRYVQLGGEFVTLGSDAHKSEQVGFRLREARIMAQEAGVRYQAVFTAGKPEFYALSE